MQIKRKATPRKFSLLLSPMMMMKNSPRRRPLALRLCLFFFLAAGFFALFLNHVGRMRARKGGGEGLSHHISTNGNGSTVSERITAGMGSTGSTTGGIRKPQQQQQQQQQPKVVATAERAKAERIGPIVEYDEGREDVREALSYLKSFRNTGRHELGRGPLVFFHIPKTAGTAIEYAAGTKRKLAWGSCRFRHRPKRDVCRYPEGGEWPQHIGWWHVPRQFYPVSTVDPYRDTELFAVVRDSYDRMVSEYAYICTLKVLEWRPDQCDRSKLSSGEYMNEWLQKKLKNRDIDAGTPIAYLSDNGHFTPQYEFVVGPNGVRMVDHVLRLERLSSEDADAEFSRLMRAFSLDKKPAVRLRKLNALGAESREVGSAHLGVESLDNETVKWIHAKYPNDRFNNYDDADPGSDRLAKKNF